MCNYILDLNHYRTAVTQAKGERLLSKPTTTLDTGLKIEQAPLQERGKKTSGYYE